MWKDSVGVELYGISYANEPQFSEPYNSSIWGDAELNDIITRGAPLLAARGLHPKIFAAEHMFWAGIGPYSNTVGNSNLYAFAVHGYSDGVSPDYGTAADWQNLYNTCHGQGKKLWMTETTCNADFLTTAKNLHTAFKSGRVSGWTWWAYGDNVVQTGTDVPKDCFYGTKHYSRFVRPEAVMLTCTSDQTGVWVTAFRNTDQTYAVVIINNGGATTVDLTGSNVPSTFQKYVSAGTSRVAHQGTVGRTGISIAGNSVTTLFSGEDITAASRPYNPAVVVAAQRPAVSARLFTLQGRQLGSFRAASLEALRGAATLVPGTYYAVFLNAAGEVVDAVTFAR
jgi:O-glycosyl hydrolase